MNELTALTDRLRRTRRTLDRQVGEAKSVAATGKRVQAEIAHLRTQVDLHERAAAVLASIADERQNTLQTQIETIVTHGLRTVFDEDLSFHLVASKQRNTPVIDFVVRSHIGEQVLDTDVLGARGGGLAAIVGILLRVVVLLLSPDTAPLLALDETAAHVSAEYLPRLAAFLRGLVERTDLQLVMVTHHSEAFAELADVVHRFEARDGITTVTTS